MQCTVKRFTQCCAIGFAMALSACGGGAEEAPDITEAIPLNLDEEGEASAGSVADGVSTQDGESAAGTAPLPDAGSPDAQSAEASGSATSSDARQRSLPDSMETGSNPPGFEPPKGSKVQRFN